MQSLVLSGELLHYVLLPQFKSQELETNAPQTELAHAKRTLGSSGWLRSSVRKSKKLSLYLYWVQESTRCGCIWYHWGDKHQIILCKLTAITAVVSKSGLKCLSSLFTACSSLKSHIFAVMQPNESRSINNKTDATFRYKTGAKKSVSFKNGKMNDLAITEKNHHN